ncbi:MAG: hypothetical protein ACXWIN_07890 [Burkholderiaceae bacterium]
MLKWIVMFVCALTLTACGSMSNTANTTSSGSSGSSGYSGQNYASGSNDVVGALPGMWGSGTFGDGP